MKAIFVACLFVAIAGSAAAGELARPAPTPRLSFDLGVNDSVPKVRSGEELKATMDRIGVEKMAGLRGWQREKSARVAMFSSMLLPGLGQTYNGRRWKTVVMVGFAAFYGGSAWIEKRRSDSWLKTRDELQTGTTEWREADFFYQFHKENSLDYTWWSGAVWLIGVLDAFIDAHLFDIRAVDPAVFAGSSNRKYIGLAYRL